MNRREALKIVLYLAARTEEITAEGAEAIAIVRQLIDEADSVDGLLPVSRAL